MLLETFGENLTFGLLSKKSTFQRTPQATFYDLCKCYSATKINLLQSFFAVPALVG